MSLKSILDELGLEVGEGGGEPGGGEKKPDDEPKIDLEKVPEDLRPQVQAQIDKVKNAEQALLDKEKELNTYKDLIAKVKPGEKVEPKVEPKVEELGIPKDDFYYPHFKKLTDELTALRKEKDEILSSQKEWLDKVAEFLNDHEDLKENPELQRGMDRWLFEFPELKSTKKGMELAYKLAKGVMKKGELTKAAKKKLEEQEQAKKLGFETPGISTELFTPGQAKTVKEAFEMAETQIAKKGAK